MCLITIYFQKKERWDCKAATEGLLPNTPARSVKYRDHVSLLCAVFTIINDHSLSVSLTAGAAAK